MVRQMSAIVPIMRRAPLVHAKLANGSPPGLFGRPLEPALCCLVVARGNKLLALNSSTLAVWRLRTSVSLLFNCCRLLLAWLASSILSACGSNCKLGAGSPVALLRTRMLAAQLAGSADVSASRAPTLARFRQPHWWPLVVLAGGPKPAPAGLWRCIAQLLAWRPLACRRLLLARAIGSRRRLGSWRVRLIVGACGAGGQVRAAAGRSVKLGIGGKKDKQMERARKKGPKNVVRLPPGLAGCKSNTESRLDCGQTSSTSVGTRARRCRGPVSVGMRGAAGGRRERHPAAPRRATRLARCRSRIQDPDPDPDPDPVRPPIRVDAVNEHNGARLWWRPAALANAKFTRLGRRHEPQVAAGRPACCARPARLGREHPDTTQPTASQVHSGAPTVRSLRLHATQRHLATLSCRCARVGWNWVSIDAEFG